MSDIETFRSETRAWLEANCPASMRWGSDVANATLADDLCWGGKKETFPNPDAKVWLERMAARGWTAPTWPKDCGGADLSREQAKVLAEEMLARGYNLVSGGTDTHLMLVDLRPKNLTGKVAEKVLGLAEITVNKNSIPNDPQSPFVTSGIRLGTPALTTRGFDKAAFRTVAALIDSALTDQSEENLKRVKGQVHELADQFPLYKSVAAAQRKIA